MIDFKATLSAIRDYSSTIVHDCGREDQVTNIMMGVCEDALVGKYTFNETDADAFSQSFVGYTRKRGLLRLAA